MKRIAFLLLALSLVAIAQNPVVRTADAAANNGILVGNPTPEWIRKTLPSCSNGTTSKLLYNNSTNEFSCGTDQTGGGAGATSIEHYFPIGNRSGSANNVASPWNMPTTGGAAAALVGTNPSQIVMDFDASTDENVTFRWRLPANWDSGGNTTFRIEGNATATTGNVIMGFEVGCSGDGETYIPSLGSVQNLTWTPSATTLARAQAVITLTMTGCAAGEHLMINIFRDADNGSDTMTGDFRLVAGTLTLPIT